MVRLSIKLKSVAEFITMSISSLIPPLNIACGVANPKEQLLN